MVSLHAAVLAMALSSTGQTVLLDFYADGCAPCKQMEPTVQALAKAYPLVTRINIEQDQWGAAKRLKPNVTKVPCFVMIVNGQEVDRVVGPTTYERLEKMCKMAGGGASEKSPLLSFGARKKEKAAAEAAAIAPTNIPPVQSPAAMPGWQKAPAAVVPQGTAAIGSFASNTPPAAASGVVPTAFQQSNAAPSEEKLIAASVRIRVEDPNGHSCGSGTIIESHDGMALVLTCGHIFRDSAKQGKIEVDLFGPNGMQPVPGQLVSCDYDKNDVGLIGIRIPSPVAVARIAPPGYRVYPGQAVVSVGCNQGDNPSARRSKISAIDRYVVGTKNPLCPTDIEVADQPVEGRSGGGLFSADGYLIGVCYAADPSDKEGLYSGVSPIYAELDRVNLACIYQTPGTGANVVAATASTNAATPPPTAAVSANSGSANSPANTTGIPAGITPPSQLPDQTPSQIAGQINPMAGAGQTTGAVANPMPSQMPASLASTSSGAPTAAAGDVFASQGTMPAALSGANLPPHEQAALSDLKAKVKQGATVVCIVNNPNGQSEVFMLDNASPEIRRQLSAAGRPQTAPYETSLEVPRQQKPQKKVLLEWSAEPNRPNAAWKADATK
jgi:thiol-disulfide isomerase/thioredoxin